MVFPSLLSADAGDMVKQSQAQAASTDPELCGIAWGVQARNGSDPAD